MGHNRHLGRETLDMFSLFLKEAFGNQHGKICVLMSRCLEHVVQGTLHFLPNRVTVGTNDHAPFNRSVICQLSRGDHVGIPACIVVFPLGYLYFTHALVLPHLAR